MQLLLGVTHEQARELLGSAVVVIEPQLASILLAGKDSCATLLSA